MADLAYINEHRKAVGRQPFAELTETEVRECLDLIEANAPYGIDPWSFDDA